MECGKQNIKIVEGNEFALVLPLKQRTFVASTPIDEDIVYADLQDVVFKIGDTQFTPTLETYGVQVLVPYNALPRGTYDILLTATYHGSEIRAAYFEALTRVQYNSQSDAQQYIAGSPIVLDAAYVIGGTLTDAELEALKEEYREKNAQLQQAIEDAEAAKAEWEQKAADLDGVAQESTSQDILTAVENIDIDTSDLAKEATLERVEGKVEQATIPVETLQALSDNLQTMVNKRNAFGGYVFTDDHLANSITEVLYEKDKLVSVYDEQVTTISGYYTFQSCTQLQSVSMPNLVTISGGNAFYSCTQLQSVSMPNLVTISGSNAFYGCTQLQSISLPNVVTISGSGTFQNCTQLQSVSLPNVVTISGSTFYNCSQLQSVSMPNLVTISSSYTFQNCTQLQSISLPKVATIGSNYTFSNCGQLRSVNLSQCGNIYPTQQFNGDTKLIDLTIGAAMTANFNINSWDPTEALNTTQSLLTPEDIATGFTTNKEKLLYNIREHIAANLPDRTGLSSLTVTFSANIKAAINGDTATANAFANKNWIIA